MQESNVTHGTNKISVPTISNYVQTFSPRIKYNEDPGVLEV